MYCNAENAGIVCKSMLNHFKQLRFESTDTGAWFGDLYYGIEMMGEIEILLIVNKYTVWNKCLYYVAENYVSNKKKLNCFLLLKFLPSKILTRKHASRMIKNLVYCIIGNVKKLHKLQNWTWKYL